MNILKDAFRLGPAPTLTRELTCSALFLVLIVALIAWGRTSDQPLLAVGIGAAFIIYTIIRLAVRFVRGEDQEGGKRHD